MQVIQLGDDYSEYPKNRSGYHVQDYIGWKFGSRYVTGRWRVVIYNRKWPEMQWETQCECGSRPTFSKPSEIFSVLYPRCNHCRDLRSGEANPGRRVVKDIPSSIFLRLQRGCRRGDRVLECTVTQEYLQDLWDKSRGVCALSKLPISFKDKTASIDRIDSAEGYVEGNVQFVHKLLNKMKMDLKEDQFIYLCSLVALHKGNYGPEETDN